MDVDETSVSSQKSDGGQQGGGQPGDIDDLLFLDQNLTAASIAPTKECVIFLIDCAPSMHTLFEEEHTTPLTSILKVTDKDSLQYKICYMYYIDRKSELEISYSVNYSVDNIKKIKSKINKKIVELK